MASEPVRFAELPAGAVLADHHIREVVDEHDLIVPFAKGSLQGASYDLRLGREYVTHGIHTQLSTDQPSCRLSPGQFVLFTSLERLRVPTTVVGHAGLISRWAQRGLISLFSPQIDPGFEGLIVVPLFNAGNAPVTLKLRETIFTVEFVRVTCVAKSWTDTHNPLDSIPASVEVEMARPDFGELADQLRTLMSEQAALKSRFDGYESGLGERRASSNSRAAWWAVGLAIVAILVAIGVGIASLAS